MTGTLEYDSTTGFWTMHVLAGSKMPEYDVASGRPRCPDCLQFTDTMIRQDFAWRCKTCHAGEYDRDCMSCGEQMEPSNQRWTCQCGMVLERGPSGVPSLDRYVHKVKTYTISHRTKSEAQHRNEGKEIAAKSAFEAVETYANKNHSAKVLRLYVSSGPAEVDEVATEYLICTVLESVDGYGVIHVEDLFGENCPWTIPAPPPPEEKHTVELSTKELSSLVRILKLVAEKILEKNEDQ